jgi:hypothetical protein
MKWFAQISLIVGIHVAFLFMSYGTKFLGLNLPSSFSAILWLGFPAIFAFAAYFIALQKTKWFVSAIYREGLWVFCAIFAAFISSYIGVFLAINTYGE